MTRTVKETLIAEIRALSDNELYELVFSNVHIGTAIRPLSHKELAANKVAENRGIRDFMQILNDLDRCQHGRHEGDVCAQCKGASQGNPRIAAGQQIGYTLDGDPIIRPSRDDKHVAANWYGESRRRRA